MGLKIAILSILFSTLIVNTLFAEGGNTKIGSFTQAKKILSKQIYNTPELRFGIYSGCSYQWQKWRFESGKERMKQVVDKESCGYVPRTDRERTHFIEWEHIVPAHAFGHALPCWREGRRKLCSKSSTVFKLMEADLFNLSPATGELNADRSNYSFTMIPGESRRYGEVDFEVDFKARKVEPPEFARGRIARTYKYFHKTYGLPISDKQMKLFDAWDKQYPMSEKERVVYSKIEAIQGNKFTY